MLSRPLAAGVRCMRSSQRKLSAISFAEFGAPQNVLKLGDTVVSADASQGFVRVAVKSSRVSAEDIRAITGQSLINTSRGVAGTTGVGSVVGSGCANVSEGSSVFVVGSGTWNDHVTVRGESVFPLPALPADVAAQVDVVASAIAILEQSSVASGQTICVDVADEALSAALSAVAKNNSVKVIKAGDKLDNVQLVVSSAAGEAISKLAKSIAKGGTVIRVNAAANASEAGVTSGVGAFIFQDKSIRGFDFHAFAAHDPVACGRAVAAAAALLADKKVALPAAKAYAQKEFAASIEAAQTGKSAILNISK